MKSEYVLEMKNCTKKFPGVVALDDVSFFLKRGQVHALVGENGAGKSTIMKVLAGIYQLDSGEILLDGEPFMPKHPADALEKGISMVHQELDLVPDMTVEMNMFAGRELKRGIALDKRKMLTATKKAMELLGLDIDPRAKISSLSVAQMQMVAIAKAIAFNTDIIILDEPTSAITEREVRSLFDIVRRLKEQNKAIIYISHKMEEIYEITDQITVLRDGKLIGSIATNETTSEQLIEMMVGRDLSGMYVKNARRSADYDENEVLLRIDGLTREKEFEDISFEVKRGEILGIYGLMGAGRTEVVETLFGLRKADTGTVTVQGGKGKINTPGKAIKAGMGFISEDRKLFGLNLIASVRSNITMAYLDKVLVGRFLMNFKRERQLADEKIQEMDIKTPNRDTPVGSLSGGNQQKVIIAKWLLGDPNVLIMDEPTRGIDIGAKADVYKLMDAFVKQGKAIIMISSEMPELLGMSNRVIVMHEGQITGAFNDAAVNQETIMAHAIGERGAGV